MLVRGQLLRLMMMGRGLHVVLLHVVLMPMLLLDGGRLLLLVFVGLELQLVALFLLLVGLLQVLVLVGGRLLLPVLVGSKLHFSWCWWSCWC
jgi:hypothetical protein